jgi:hypothetical protein
MKSGREHRVPLSDRALEILGSLPTEANNPYLFVGARNGGGLSNMAMLELLRGMRSKANLEAGLAISTAYLMHCGLMGSRC